MYVGAGFYVIYVHMYVHVHMHVGAGCHPQERVTGVASTCVYRVYVLGLHLA